VRIALLTILCIWACAPVFADSLPVDARIERAMFGDHRSPENIERNRYRHPVGTLTFFGLEDGMTVMEIWPGAGWYTEILAPVLRNNGQLIVAGYDIDVPDQPRYRYGLQQSLLDKFAASGSIYDQVAIVPFSPPASASLGDPGSVDLVVTFRNTHGWITDGVAEVIFAEFFRVLKPGGVLGVVQHRAEPGSDPLTSAEMGYVPEQTVIELARGAGLYLEGRSEVNANPRDSKDYEGGVWSLPPGLGMCEEIEDADGIEACRARYLAIGESDRMTLRFRKPLE